MNFKSNYNQLADVVEAKGLELNITLYSKYISDNFTGPELTKIERLFEEYLEDEVRTIHSKKYIELKIVICKSIKFYMQQASCDFLGISLINEVYEQTKAMGLQDFADYLSLEDDFVFILKHLRGYLYQDDDEEIALSNKIEAIIKDHEIAPKSASVKDRLTEILEDTIHNYTSEYTYELVRLYRVLGYEEITTGHHYY